MAHPGKLMRIPPPIVFLAAFLVGVGLQRIPFLAIHVPGVRHLSHIAGITLIGCGILIALSCVGLFFAKRTTVIPFGTASSLVTWGPYRFSRNPMYVSVVLMYLGAAVSLLQVWPVILLPLPVLVVQKIVIPFEEARLREVFGETYVNYCGRVRRWL